MARPTALALATALAALGSIFGGCTGDDESSGGAGGGSWTPGVFLPSDTFIAQCANPRVGTDPSTGNPFQDVQGSATTENEWLRSWSNELYLWYDEILDIDPASTPTDLYFKQMKSFETTPSGAFKDKFHFSLPTDEWQQFSQSGVTAGYGAEWVVLSPSPPRELVVAYTEPGSPATSAGAGLARGARVIEIDGVDLVNASDPASIAILEAGLSPMQPGESHVFTVLDLGSSTPRTFTMTSADVTSDPVQYVSTIDTPSGRLGYVLFNDHIATAEQELIGAFNVLDAANIDDLVLDLRYNGGGYLVVASQLAYMIAGPVPTAGRTFELVQFNDKHPVTNPVTGTPLTPLPFVDESIGLSAPAGMALPTLNLPRVFVLTGPNTCSASESVMNSLDGVDVEVIQIGSTTCGKPYGFYPADNCGTTYFTIQFQGVNDKGFGDYTDGFSPANTVTAPGTIMAGCSVADDLDHALGDPAEGRFAAALQYRDFGSCPAASGLAEPPGLSKPGPTTPKSDGRLIRPPWRELRTLDR